MSLPAPRSRRAHSHHPHLHRGSCACRRCSMSHRFLGECVPSSHSSICRTEVASTCRVLTACVGLRVACHEWSYLAACSLPYVSVSSCGITNGSQHQWPVSHTEWCGGVTRSVSRCVPAVASACALVLVADSPESGAHSSDLFLSLHRSASRVKFTCVSASDVFLTLGATTGGVCVCLRGFQCHFSACPFQPKFARR